MPVLMVCSGAGSSRPGVVQWDRPNPAMEPSAPLRTSAAAAHRERWTALLKNQADSESSKGKR